MTELIPGKRYRWTVEGTATAFQAIRLAETELHINMHVIQHGTVELLSDPLPSTPGSVILDNEGDPWMLWGAWGNPSSGEWRRPGGSRSSAADLEASGLGPFTVLFDAGAQRA